MAITYYSLVVGWNGFAFNTCNFLFANEEVYAIAFGTLSAHVLDGCIYGELLASFNLCRCFQRDAEVVVNNICYAYGINAECAFVFVCCGMEVEHDIICFNRCASQFYHHALPVSSAFVILQADGLYHGCFLVRIDKFYLQVGIASWNHVVFKLQRWRSLVLQANLSETECSLVAAVQTRGEDRTIVAVGIHPCDRLESVCSSLLTDAEVFRLCIGKTFFVREGVRVADNDRTECIFAF